MLLICILAFLLKNCTSKNCQNQEIQISDDEYRTIFDLGENVFDDVQGADCVHRCLMVGPYILMSVHTDRKCSCLNWRVSASTVGVQKVYAVDLNRKGIVDEIREV